MVFALADRRFAATGVYDLSAGIYAPRPTPPEHALLGGVAAGEHALGPGRPPAEGRAARFPGSRPGRTGVREPRSHPCLGRLASSDAASLKVKAGVAGLWKIPWHARSLKMPP